MSVPYTTGNWTVSRLHVGSESAKAYSIPKIDFPLEFSRTEKPPRREKAMEMEAYFASVSGSSLAAAGNLIVGRDRIKNIYNSYDYDPSAQLAQKNGVKGYTSLTLYYRAVNSVSGQECYFPISGSLQLTIPASAIVTLDALYDFVGFMVSSQFAKDETVPNISADIIRGDLDPTT